MLYCGNGCDILYDLNTYEIQEPTIPFHALANDSSSQIKDPDLGQGIGYTQTHTQHLSNTR